MSVGTDRTPSGAARHLPLAGEGDPSLPASALDLRVGWCPGALRPMRVGDGLLVRIKPRGHRLSLVQARSIASLARRYGSGALTLTARGNLQLRAIDEGALPAVTAALAALGLLDGDPDGEAVRNVVSNPLAGADPTAAWDVREAVKDLETLLCTDDAMARLPAKFGWSVDGGGRLPVADVPADVRFSTIADDRGARRLLIALAGTRDRAVAPLANLVAVAAQLAEAFLALCAAHGLRPHRMRDLVAVCGGEAVFAQAGLAALDAPDAPVERRLGIGCHRHGAWSFVGASPAFGLLDAASLEAVVGHAEAAGAGELRLTPWRSLLVPGLDEKAAIGLATALAMTPLILDPIDPRLGVAACVGQPACRRATTAVPADAARLTAAAPSLRLHVSGCAKGCAEARPAPVTLVGRDGLYDLVVDGRAGDLPRHRALSVERLLTMLPAYRKAAS